MSGPSIRPQPPPASFRTRTIAPAFSEICGSVQRRFRGDVCGSVQRRFRGDGGIVHLARAVELRCLCGVACGTDCPCSLDQTRRSPTWIFAGSPNFDHCDVGGPQNQMIQ
jgi:hypothetical protein